MSSSTSEGLAATFPAAELHGPADPLLAQIAGRISGDTHVHQRRSAQTGRLGTIAGIPAWFLAAFGEVGTHVTLAPISTQRPTWPVVLFAPGWGSPCEDYSALCTDLASRDYVVVALSHPYASAVALLANGRVVGQTSDASISHAGMAHLSAIRAAGS